MGKTHEGMGEPKERDDLMFEAMRRDAESLASQSALLGHMRELVLDSSSLAEVIAATLAQRMATSLLPEAALKEECLSALKDDRRPGADLEAVMLRDPASLSHLSCVLYLKGFQAMQAHRVAAKLWARGDKHVALALQNRTSEVWGVDIHPAATMGSGLLLDHATGVVVGETAVVGDNCTILHGVTLGGTGKERGDRHPKIGDRVSIGAGATVLGNIRVANDVTIGAMAVVTKDVPAGMTVVGLNRVLDPNQPRRSKPVHKETWWAETDVDSYDYFSIPAAPAASVNIDTNASLTMAKKSRSLGTLLN